MASLLLDRTTWDLCVTASRDIAVASAPYCVLQDVATAVRTFVGECWYDTAKGIAYFSLILGVGQSPAAFRAQVEATAKAVSGVADARCVLTAIGADRVLSGAILVTLTTGGTASVSF
ncbi:hypothetical protein NO263_09950 [Gluconacetobacter entanii]|uniref:Uncharacterized protein n=1 Tax=Gluconacetobacter entanii TaxID=108528 RepID=A0A318PQ73_9PROT|nr:hypothetical protein [Gluconacetobacter entanii]MCE2578678.1 hypothetical protein [Komagataeibacter sp. FNDCR1]MCW4590902.1 hypothetical protein [Gluconacetobacter entanii]MCW4592527.1 hypothetical protein [Gluconacetobacter entanii]NPC87325.1 hypothetical protein [Gluconacetobacter entanii]PYD61402.1 hypothetical protein CFR72_14370 [Gluconacetobacter entanii]